MTARNYDVILTVNGTTGFVSGNTIIGVTSKTQGFIANVDSATNKIKVKINNAMQEFSSTEQVFANAIVISGTANGALSGGDDGTKVPFQSNVQTGSESTLGTATISAIAPSPFKAEKNAFTQNPIVRLYEIFYPGEWFPFNRFGNPTGAGAGKSWPSIFPLRFADIRGDLISDLQYNVTYDGTSYIPFPVNLSSIDQDADGKINELSLTIFNVDNIISSLIEDPFLVGENDNADASMSAHVNGELVSGIDRRTVPQDTANYDLAVVGQYGKTNAAWTYSTTLAKEDPWKSAKSDTRDLLGGVVNIKTTFANFLDVWPEYSSVRYISGNVVEVFNAMPYRVGDNVRSSIGDTEATVQLIQENKFLFLSGDLDQNSAVGDNIFIVNQDKDTDSYIEDRFRIDQLEKMDESTATFGLVSWLQYFKQQTPNRKYYKNTCQWEYKGEECQYPGPGDNNTDTITAATKTNPVVLTLTTTNMINTQRILIENVSGMTQLNTNKYFANVLSSTTVALYSDSALTTTINGTGFGTYTSGGTAKSGAIIPGSLRNQGVVAFANTSPITAANETAASLDLDVCGKNIQACSVRNNTLHFGGFPATGRTVPVN